MNRGDRREAIFEDDEDRERLLQTLTEAYEKTRWEVHAYCLMRNHFHLVIETPQPNLVAGMKEERVKLEIGPANKLMPEGQGREPERLKSWVYPPSVPLGAGLLRLLRPGSLKSGGGSPRSMQMQVFHCWH